MGLRSKVTETPAVAFFALLILAAFLAEPYSFARDWNEGRSALLAVVPLLLLELRGDALRPLPSPGRAYGAYAVVVLSSAYYVSFAEEAVRQSLVLRGVALGINPLIAQYSWVWGVDYAVSSAFLLALILLSSNPRAVTPLIYSLGMTSFLFTDSALPYNSLGPFGYVIPPALQAVSAFVDALLPGTVESSGNVLALQNHAGSMRLEVFWPSAGLDGIVLGLLVVVAVCSKLGTGWRRGALYLIVGAAGSFAVNILRITLLTFYALSDITNPKGFEAFHSVAGELVFLPWIALYVLMILRHEGRLWASSRPTVPLRPGGRTARG